VVCPAPALTRWNRQIFGIAEHPTRNYLAHGDEALPDRQE
jgi:hypothetical protein